LVRLQAGLLKFAGERKTQKENTTMRIQKKGAIFNADAHYMRVTYGAQAFDSAEFHYEPEEALDVLGWDVTENGFDDEYWADIVTTRKGKTLAVIADGAWGQPSTYYHAVLEVEVVPSCPRCEMNGADLERDDLFCGGCVSKEAEEAALLEEALEAGDYDD
jgi:hypothetical protein